MIYHIALVLLGPLLLAQGKYVRRVTPKLPEPDGLRYGQSGQGPELSLLIVGDSAAAGVGADHQQRALSGNLIGSLSKTHTVRWKLLAQSGDTSQLLLEKLGVPPAEEFSTALVSIGVNDVISQTRPGVWAGNLRLIIRQLEATHGVQRVYLSSIPPMHLFPALPNPLRWWLGLRARHFNALMQTVADNEPSCSYLPIPYSGDLNEIASDGFHPGPRAYKVWGEYVAAVIQQDGGG